MKIYTVTQAREKLGTLIWEASTGIDIEIQVYGHPYVKMTAGIPERRVPAILINQEAAVSHWSQLLSAIANNEARFFFVTPQDTEVFLVRVDGYRNLWLAEWGAHVRRHGGVDSC